MFVLKPDSADDLRFPPVELASPEGLLAVGGDLRAERLLEAYRHGIFPWYSAGQPILWWSPDPRAVLFPEKLRVSRSLHKTLKRKKFEVTLDKAFRDVMRQCAQPRELRPGHGTWITPEMIEAYCVLHERGLAHSVESWMGGKLVGGLYGVALGGVFLVNPCSAWKPMPPRWRLCSWSGNLSSGASISSIANCPRHIWPAWGRRKSVAAIS